MPRSGFLVVLSQQSALKLDRRPVAERGVQTFLVVDLLEKEADAGTGQGASYGGEMQFTVTEAHTERQMQEGNREPGQIFGHGAAQEEEVSLEEGLERGLEFRVLFHHK